MQLAPGPRHSQYGNGCPEPSGASWSIHVIAAPGLSTAWSLLPFPVMFPATSCHSSRKATWYSLVHCVHFGPSPSPRLSVLPEAAHLSLCLGRSHPPGWSLAKLSPQVRICIHQLQAPFHQSPGMLVKTVHFHSSLSSVAAKSGIWVGMRNL